MRYRVKNDNYHTFEIFERNKLSPRAYFIPFSDKERARLTPPTEARYKSDLVTCLSGEWEFCFFKDPKKLSKEIDADSLTYDKVTVPSVWEYTGYLDPQYLCTFVPFHFAPPRVPKEKELGMYFLSYNTPRPVFAFGQYNSVGVYRRKFSVTDVTKNYVVSFLGVCSCFDLFVNGQYVGYSEGSHNTAEFSLNEYLTAGENEMLVVVHRFSTGCYLECQDMFRNNGIFRDVLLYATDKEHILDYEIRTEYADGKYTLKAEVFIENPTEGTVSLEIFDRIFTAGYDEKGVAEFSIECPEVKEWSAEIPNLYTLIIGFREKEYVGEEVGFRHIEIKEDVYYFNGKKIKLFGVNHHDTHPEKGPALSPQDIERDIRLMKQYNVNAVRTSHYPPDPLFVRLCDRYGLYVIDEADIETHCAHACRNMCIISDDPKWASHYVDRVKRMFMRDRNHCSVIMWSLGNESGGVYCQQQCYDFLKPLTSVPIHYEGVMMTEKVSFDIVSEMYPPLAKVKKNAEMHKTDPRWNKPYLLCEYAHAMGVGPGSIEEYVSLFLSEDVYLGGCVWEWADHAVYHPETGNYTYGGDHHDYLNDGTFCVDGLFRPDRTPYTSAHLMRTAYRPIRAKYLGGGEVSLTNVRRFLATDDLEVKTTFIVDGIAGEESSVLPSIQPQGNFIAKFEIPKGDEVFLNLAYVERETGRELAKEQLTISEHIPEVLPPAGTVRTEEKKGRLTCFFEGGEIVFDLRKGGIASYKVGGVELIASPRNRLKVPGIYTELFRAPTDNDRNLDRKHWRWIGYRRFRRADFRSEVKRGEQIRVIFSSFIHGCTFIFGRIRDEYTVFADGTVRVEAEYQPFRSYMLPRFGKVLELKKEFDKVRYYGRGDMENYPDMKVHAPIGVYEQEGDFGVKMIVPQTSGERCDVRWAEITDKSGVGLKICADKTPFGLNVNHYTEKDVTAWKHIVDYRDFDATYVNIDGFMMGIGSNSCGPLPEEEYRIPEGKILRYSFWVSPCDRRRS